MLKEDLKKISTLSLSLKGGTPVIKIKKNYKTKEISLENFLLTVKTKIESYIFDFAEILGNKFTRIKLYYDFIKLLLIFSSCVTEFVYSYFRTSLLKLGHYDLTKEQLQEALHY